ncbi:MAG: class I SAM-dependent methyltransferase [Synergistaceae bacterium]|jgi:SAM-dependent methyltransferase|nr:class I SAM-dependent methyltransferase [Synergistaceae bacterium]
MKVIDFDWKLKSRIQNAIALLPDALSYEVYFQVQRRFGGLKKPFDPMGHFASGAWFLRKIREHGGSAEGKIFFEVGTGRVPIVPVAYWLGRAGKIITVDLNPYMRKELMEDMFFYITKEEEKIRAIFGDLLDDGRFGALLEYGRAGKINVNEVLEMCEIEYLAPKDASKTGLPERSADYHTSNAVYEHIPREILKNILEEGNRIIKPDGLFINGIDYSDHFAQMDKGISQINFLQYDEKEWDKYAGNRYMYMNRLRHDDFLGLFAEVGHEVIETETTKSEDAERILDEGKIKINERFKNKGNEILSIIGSSFITRKK